MKIKDPLLGTYQIDFDGTTYVLEKVGVNSNTGDETLTPLGYYTSLPVLIKKVVSLQISEVERTLDLQTFINEFRTICENITKALTV